MIKTLEYLKKIILYYKKDEVVFIDIGCGKGKPNYIFSKLFPQVTSCGIDMHNYYKKFFINNLKLVTKNFIFINEKAECINFNLFNKKN